MFCFPKDAQASFLFYGRRRTSLIGFFTGAFLFMIAVGNRNIMEKSTADVSRRDKSSAIDGTLRFTQEGSDPETIKDAYALLPAEKPHAVRRFETLRQYPSGAESIQEKAVFLLKVCRNKSAKAGCISCSGNCWNRVKEIKQVQL